MDSEPDKVEEEWGLLVEGEIVRMYGPKPPSNRLPISLNGKTAMVVTRKITRIYSPWERLDV